MPARESKRLLIIRSSFWDRQDLRQSRPGQGRRRERAGLLQVEGDGRDGGRRRQGHHRDRDHRRGQRGGRGGQVGLFSVNRLTG